MSLLNNIFSLISLLFVLKSEFDELSIKNYSLIINFGSKCQSKYIQNININVFVIIKLALAEFCFQ